MIFDFSNDLWLNWSCLNLISFLKERNSVPSELVSCSSLLAMGDVSHVSLSVTVEMNKSLVAP